ncbi:TfuA-like protein [Streptomyces sp. NPDC099088]|uniref:TfuA-like protein n=1 Tax=Streptomyces sp. NPDC099088 TaxID=3366101 RepID=UPI00381BAFDE
MAAGDLLKIGARPGDSVAIIDGYFHQRPSVRHKEILHLIDSGVTVHGAASMGALRAAELAAFGMIGHGRIFHDYYSGAITADDEVALLHGTEDEEFQPYTEALINIRYAVEQAVTLGMLDARAGRTALTAASKLAFSERSRTAIVDAAMDAGLDEYQGSALRSIIRTAVDQKKKDATLLLSTLGRQEKAQKIPAASWRLHETAFLADWRASARGTRDPELGVLSDPQVHEICQLFATDYPDFRVQTATAALASAHCKGHATHQSQDAALARLRSLGILVGDSESSASLERWSAPSELSMPARQRTLKAAARALFTTTALSLDDPFTAALHAHGTYADARDVLARSLRYHQRITSQRGLNLQQLRADNVIRWYAKHWNADNMEDATLHRGFTSVDQFLSAARRHYLYGKNASKESLILQCLPKRQLL